MYYEQIHKKLHTPCKSTSLAKTILLQTLRNPFELHLLKVSTQESEFLAWSSLLAIKFFKDSSKMLPMLVFCLQKTITSWKNMVATKVWWALKLLSIILLEVARSFNKLKSITRNLYKPKVFLMLPCVISWFYMNLMVSTLQVDATKECETLHFILHIINLWNKKSNLDDDLIQCSTIEAHMPIIIFFLNQ